MTLGCERVRDRVGVVRRELRSSTMSTCPRCRRTWDDGRAVNGPGVCATCAHILGIARKVRPLLERDPERLELNREAPRWAGGGAT